MKHLILAALVTSLAACATSSPDVVQRHEAQRLSHVQEGTVLNERGAESGEDVGVPVGMPRQMPLDELWVGGHRFGEAREAGAAG